MKWLLRTDSFAKYSLDRFAARPWNQSSRLSEEGKLIPVEAQVVKPAEGFTVSYKLFAGVCGPRPWDSAAIRTIFQIQSQMLSSNFSRSFLTKLCLPVGVAVGRRKRKETTTTGNSFLFRWTSGLRGFITNPQGPSRFILLLSPLLSLPCLYPLSLHYSFTRSALLYQSHCFCCALKHSHKLTCWILNWDIKPRGSSVERKLFYILSLWKLFMFITWCTRWISAQRTNVPHLKSATRLQGRKTFSSWDQKTDEDIWGFGF